MSKNIFISVTAKQMNDANEWHAMIITIFKGRQIRAALKGERYSGAKIREDEAPFVGTYSCFAQVAMRTKLHSLNICVCRLIIELNYIATARDLWRPSAHYLYIVCVCVSGSQKVAH